MSIKGYSRGPRPAAGFTLIEIMVVVVILGILAALIAPNIIGNIDKAQVTAVKQDLRVIESALDMYRLERFRYPSTDEGLNALVTAPSDPTVPWPAGGYIKRLPKDPWGRPYLYTQPGTHGEVDVYSLGRDGAPGGTGVDADIGNWDEK
jgi:general secretion pathway protein G